MIKPTCLMSTKTRLCMRAMVVLAIVAMATSNSEAESTLPEGATRDEKDPRIIRFSKPKAIASPSPESRQDAGSSGYFKQHRSGREEVIEILSQQFFVDVEEASLTSYARHLNVERAWVLEPMQAVSAWLTVRQQYSSGRSQTVDTVSFNYPGWLWENLAKKLGSLPQVSERSAKLGFWGDFFGGDSPSASPKLWGQSGMRIEVFGCRPSSTDSGWCTIRGNFRVVRYAGTQVVAVPARRFGEEGELLAIWPSSLPVGTAGWLDLLSISRMQGLSVPLQIQLPTSNLTSAIGVTSRDLAVAWGSEIRVGETTAVFDLRTEVKIESAAEEATFAEPTNSIVDARRANLFVWRTKNSPAKTIFWLPKKWASVEY